ncbi:MAG: VanZ family protein [Eubacteriales bacterium]|nr:VanZ family protein [Eubacteriales bacterium]
MSKYFSKAIKVIIWVPVIFMACVIFGFSGQNGDESQGLSYKAADIVLTICDKAGIVDYNDDNKEIMIENLQLPIRKAAHMTEYAVFAVLVYVALLTDGLKCRLTVFIAFGFAFIFACTDEIHQLFISGRSGRFTDVLIDSAGCIIGLFAAWIINKACRRRKI